MKVKIGKKEYDTDKDESVARFVELQNYFVKTQKDLEAACDPNRGQLVVERNALAHELGVEWYVLPRPVRQPDHVSAASVSQM